MPALRERRDEIRPLTDFFLAKYSRKYNRPGGSISDELRQRFMAYEWPGNIRELENLIKRLVILQDELLVIREMERHIQRAAAIATAAANGGRPDRFVQRLLFGPGACRPAGCDAARGGHPGRAGRGVRCGARSRRTDRRRLSRRSKSLCPMGRSRSQASRVPRR